MTSDNELDEISSWILGVVGALVSLVCFFFMGKVLRRWFRLRQASSVQEKPTLSEGGQVSLLIQLVLPWGPLARTIEIFSVLGADDFSVLFKLPKDEPFYEALLSSLPGYIYISAYILLLLFWIRLYSSAPDDKRFFTHNVMQLWAILSCSVFAVWIVLLMLMASIPVHEVVIHQAEAGYQTTLSILLALFFAAWEIVLFRKLRQAQSAGVASTVGNKIIFLTSLCVLVFLLRGAIIIVNSFVLFTPGLASYISILIFFIICEYFPCFLMLLIIHWPTAEIKRTKEVDPDASMLLDDDDEESDSDEYAEPDFGGPREITSLLNDRGPSRSYNEYFSPSSF